MDADLRALAGGSSTCTSSVAPHTAEACDRALLCEDMAALYMGLRRGVSAALCARMERQSPALSLGLVMDDYLSALSLVSHVQPSASIHASIHVHEHGQVGCWNMQEHAGTALRGCTWARHSGGASAAAESGCFSTHAVHMHAWRWCS